MPEIVIFNGSITTVGQITFLSNHFHHGQFDTQTNRYRLIKNLLTPRNLTHHSRMFLLGKYRITECFLCESLQICTNKHTATCYRQQEADKTKTWPSPCNLTPDVLLHITSTGIMCDRKIK